MMTEPTLQAKYPPSASAQELGVAIARQGINADGDRMLAQLADQLSVDKASLVDAAKVQRLVTGEGIDLGGAA